MRATAGLEGRKYRTARDHPTTISADLSGVFEGGRQRTSHSATAFGIGLWRSGSVDQTDFLRWTAEARSGI